MEALYCLFSGGGRTDIETGERLYRGETSRSAIKPAGRRRAGR